MGIRCSVCQTKCEFELPDVQVLQWQPIDTAPKDGTFILGYQRLYSFQDEDEFDGGYTYKTCYVDSPERLTEPTFMGLTQFDEIDWEVNYYPTHWMPMPDSPDEEPIMQHCNKCPIEKG